MGFFASSDPFILVAWAAGGTTLSLAAALTVQVLRVRRRTQARARRRADFLAAWRPILFEAALGGTPALPAIDARDEDTFLLLWNDVQDAVEGESRPALNRLAEAVGADESARRRLRRGDAVASVQALRMLGHLGRPQDYDVVRELLDDARPHLSLAAARALVRIDPARTPGEVLPRIASRPDWPASLLVTALAGASPVALASALRATCAQASPPSLVRLLPLVALVDDRSSELVLREAFAAGADAELAAAVLRHARAPALVDLARAGCTHAAWTVRTQAATALGRLGGASDRYLLVALLTDAQWWVRYRAAQALVTGRFGSPRELAPLVEALQDRYARDILAHAAAEARA